MKEIITHIAQVNMTDGTSGLWPRSEVPPLAIDLVRADVAAGRCLAGTHWSVTLCPGPSRIKTFTLDHEDHPAVECLLCLNLLVADAIWKMASIRPVPPATVNHQPTHLPWLATYLRVDHPFGSNPGLFADILIEASDLDRIVAWVLIDEEDRQNSANLPFPH